MTRIISWSISIVAVTLLFTATTTRIAAQGGTMDKTTYLTFNRPVQIPGTTLAAGTYIFRIANPDVQTMWQVLDSRDHHVLAQFFFVRTKDRTIQEQNHANGKPVVRLYETAAGVTPALKVLYYPTDVAGHQFLYPKEQAKTIAAATHTPVLATDSDPAKSALAHVIAVEPETTAANEADASR